MDRKKENHLHREVELGAGDRHPGREPVPVEMRDRFCPEPSSIYAYSDLGLLGSSTRLQPTAIHSLNSIDELLDRDAKREKDGFPRKIRIGRLMKAGRGEKVKIILVPTTVEEKFIHDNREGAPEQEGQHSGGSGEGEEGEVIGEEPVHGTEGEDSGGAGRGEGGEHGIESNAYDLGRILTEKFELPNLQDKGKRKSLSRYTYDLTDRHRGFGQLLDKKATLRRIIETNIGLGRISRTEDIDPVSLLVSPRDEVYRILSKEKDYESQAVVFFIRDYSGSMSGKPTEIVVTQHVLIYSWLLYQYEKQVETRFILHDNDAREVTDFYTYYNSSVAGGTRVESAYRLVNEIVENENLARDYNIYVFHGTDGDDWDANGDKTVPELEKMLEYSSRIGITVARNSLWQTGPTTVERYVGDSKVLEEFPGKIRLDPIPDNASESRLIEGIRKLIS